MVAILEIHLSIEIEKTITLIAGKLYCHPC